MLETAITALDQARAVLVQRLDDIDLDSVRKQGVRLAGSVQSDLERRIRPPRRRISPWGVAGIAGLVALGLAAAGVGFVVADRERREAASRRMNGVQTRARERYAELTGGRTQAEADLQDRVSEAIAEGGAPPDGLEVVVEGRTVYLRGAVADTAFVDAAAERAHGVRGVVAVVNLTTSATTPRTPCARSACGAWSRSSTSPPARRASRRRTTPDVLTPIRAGAAGSSSGCRPQGEHGGSGWWQTTRVTAPRGGGGRGPAAGSPRTHVSAGSVVSGQNLPVRSSSQAEST